MYDLLLGFRSVRIKEHCTTKSTKWLTQDNENPSSYILLCCKALSWCAISHLTPCGLELQWIVALDDLWVSGPAHGAWVGYLRAIWSGTGLATANAFWIQFLVTTRRISASPDGQPIACKENWKYTSAIWSCKQNTISLAAYHKCC